MHEDALFLSLMSRLQLQIERLEVEARSKAEQLAEAKENVASLEAERQAAQRREDALRQGQTAWYSLYQLL